MFNTQEAQCCVILLWNGIVTVLMAMGAYYMTQDPAVLAAYIVLMVALTFTVNLRLYCEVPDDL